MLIKVRRLRMVSAGYCDVKDSEYQRETAGIKASDVTSVKRAYIRDIPHACELSYGLSEVMLVDEQLETLIDRINTACQAEYSYGEDNDGS